MPTKPDFAKWRILAKQLDLNLKWDQIPNVVGVYHSCYIHLRLSEFSYYPEQGVDTLLSITAIPPVEGTTSPLTIPKVTALFTLKKPLVRASRFEIKGSNHLRYRQTGIETDPAYLRLLLDTGCKVL